ncbi:MAG: glutaminyl-peptide cyclotransferase [Candidatus Bathyarchaeota archaeon]|nr:glutaminyl-peptide cyclotransferase [Candidatus Bathyarchaeota archaeon]
MKTSRLIGVLITLVTLVLTVTALIWANNGFNLSPQPMVPKQYTYEIIQVYPHDKNAFTQGLIYSDGFLYESTGLYGSSTLRKVDLETGNTVDSVSLPTEFFGEGIALVNEKIIQLTWKSQIGFVYNKENLSLIHNFTYSTEGWGLTFDGKNLIMSDGTDKLYFLDPATYKQVSYVNVNDGNLPVTNLNELEYVSGEVYANIWHEQKIAVINPLTGQVKAWINLLGIENTPLSEEEVLNGIAYDAQSNRLFVTGKNWPHLYEIKLIPVE